jgi:V/A-type H+/Na+-transporting ATPase subunit D
MGQIKLTKNELKAQRDALARFTRYLPTLQLKKQQLQLEIRNLDRQIEQCRTEEADLAANTDPWISLFSESYPWESHLEVAEIRSSRGNIAGVDIPVLEGVEFSREAPDLFLAPLWIDDALEVIEKWIHIRVKRNVLEEQARILAAELRTTTQRVNLFEKVKVPEARENIRIIRIFLGDEQTAAVARSKLAKRKSVGVV